MAQNAEARDYNKERPNSALGNATSEEYAVLAEPQTGAFKPFKKLLTEWAINGVQVIRPTSKSKRSRRESHDAEQEVISLSKEIGDVTLFEKQQHIAQGYRGI